MKVAIAQTNPIPGDFAGNIKQITDGILKASSAGADLFVSPEMGIPGYLCCDAMLTEGFVEMNLNGILTILRESNVSNKMTIVVGYVEKNTTGVGKPLFNSAAVIRNGTVIANYRKHLLPFYDVFDEGRYFEPGRDFAVVEICGRQWGIVICEDLWSNDKGKSQRHYDTSPVEKYAKLGVENLIAINSSPYVLGKPAHRKNIVQDVSRRIGGTVVYCNQRGGMDSLVFDGNSLVAHWGLIRHCCGDVDGVSMIDTSDNNYKSNDMGNPSEEMRKNIVLGLRDYIQKSGFKKVVVASSGGIDSALVLCLACDAIGADNVHAIRMPGQYSSAGSVSDALELHKNLGCHDYLMPIDNNTFLIETNRAMLSNTADGVSMSEKRSEYRTVANENIQARLRAINLMHFSNCWCAIALTTGNKSEIATGYCTLGGDCMGGFAPIQDLYKTQVYQLAQLYDSQHCITPIPASIINKAPSAELSPNQTDEASLLPYGILDLIICGYIEHKISTLDGFKNLGEKEFVNIFSYKWKLFRDQFVESFDADIQFKRIINMIDKNEFKRRQMAPGVKISNVAFGTGRRFPIVRRSW